MDTLKERIEKLIAASLREGRADLETLPNGRIVGHIIARDFEDRSFEDRRRMLWGVLNSHLTAHEKMQVSTLLTYTPEEWDIPLRET